MSQANNNPQPRRYGCLRSCLIALVIYFAISALCGWLFKDLMMTSPTVTLGDNTVYKLELAGKLVEQGAESNPFFDMLSDMPGYNQTVEVGLDQILENIRLAEQNDKIKGIYICGGRRVVIK